MGPAVHLSAYTHMKIVCFATQATLSFFFILCILLIKLIGFVFCVCVCLSVWSFKPLVPWVTSASQTFWTRHWKSAGRSPRRKMAFSQVTVKTSQKLCCVFTSLVDWERMWHSSDCSSLLSSGFRISWEEFNRTNTRVTHYLPNVTQEYKVTGLTALTTYTIQVAAMTSKGQGQLSASTISSGVPPGQCLRETQKH